MALMPLFSRSELLDWGLEGDINLTADNAPNISYGVSQLPGCCGVNVIHQIRWAFPYDRHNDVFREFISNSDARRGKWEQFVQHIKAAHGKCAKFIVSDACTPTQLRAMSIEEMCTMVRGWRGSHYTLNPNSKNYIRTWEYLLVEGFPEGSHLPLPHNDEEEDEDEDDDY